MNRRTLSLFQDYLTLCKPKVIALMLITVWIGMQLASSSFIAWQLFFFTVLGIACTGSAAAVLNHVIDRHIDAQMYRTQKRPLPTNRISAKNALKFSMILGLLGISTLIVFVNAKTALLTAFALLGYAGVYSLFLKHKTPQNIVIGGLAGAMPPLLGWTAVRGEIDPFAWVLVLIIFTWTPPHFWSLAIARLDEYKKANVPMLPVTHGIPFTKLSMLLYTILLFVVSILPFVLQRSCL